MAVWNQWSLLLMQMDYNSLKAQMIFSIFCNKVFLNKALYFFFTHKVIAHLMDYKFCKVAGYKINI